MPSYPNSLDNFTNPTSADRLSTTPHSAIETAQNIALTAIEANLGVTGSNVVTTIDYILKNTASINPGHKHTYSSITGTAPVSGGGTGQTSVTAAFNALAPSNTPGDLIVYGPSGNIRLPIGANGYFVHVNLSATGTGGLEYIASPAVYSVNADETISTWWTSILIPIQKTGTGASVKWTVSSASDVFDGNDFGVMSQTADIYAYASFLESTKTFASTKSLRVKWIYQLSGTPASGNNFGLGLGPSQTNFTDKSNNLASARFVIENLTLYAVVGSGSGTPTVSSAIGSVTVTNINLYEIVWNNGTNFLFYVNGTLVATINTTMPTSGAMNFVTAGVRSSGTISYTLGPVAISRQL